jgi:hypothetical protein
MQCLDLFDLFSKKMVKSDVSSQARPIIGIGLEVIIPLYDVHLPTHEFHLQP